ncbi:MAG TPA: sugar phosphate isomerase/epimerase family protein [Opitutaceae bacterium]|jgi:hexulose-6-phosphate isomerase|nr:sugar phosphate isomerase/epimerase family protein [Opitutaceae bacterium]
MKKAISIWSFSSAGTLEDKFRLAKDAGFAGFELELAASGPVAPASTPAELAAVRTLADRIGIELSGLATGLYWESNPASADAAVRERARQILERQIATAGALGIDAILVVPGTVGVDFIPGAEVVPYDVAWDRASAFVRGALPAAEKAGVRLCVENVWNKFLLSPLEMRQFVAQFGSDAVGAYFDVGNALAQGYPEQWISILGPAIRRVHCKDYRRAVGSISGFVDLLAGDVNWPAVMHSLRSAGYGGWLTAEMIPPVPFYRHAPETLIYNCARAMDALLAL